MDIKIEGNPGTGNTFQEITINNPQNVNPNATTVNNYNYYGTSGEGAKTKTKMTMKDMLDQDLIDTTPLRKEIMNYVSCIREFVKPEWKDKFMPLWDDILNLKEVEACIYDPGKQQGTNYNRKLVAAIMHYLDSQKIYQGPYNAKAMAEALEDNWEHSVRRELAGDLSDEIKAAIAQLIKAKYE